MNDWRDCETMLRHLGEFDVPDSDRLVLCWVDGTYSVGQFTEGAWSADHAGVVECWCELPPPPPGAGLSVGDGPGLLTRHTEVSK